MSEWTKICRIHDIPVLGSRRVARPQGMDVAVFRSSADKVFALLDRCPHKGGPLSQGIVFGETVACPLHNMTIDLADGCVRAPDEGCTPKFACKVEGGEVYLDVGELATLALDLLPPRAGRVHRRTGRPDLCRADTAQFLTSPFPNPACGSRHA